MATQDFHKLIRETERKRDLLTKEVQKEILKSYQELYKKVNSKLNKLDENTLNKRHLEELKKSLEKEIKTLNNNLNKRTKQLIEESVQLGLDSQLTFFSEISKEYDLGLEKTFNSMFATIHKEVVAEILGGKVYKDRKGLSTRIWSDTKRFNKDIDMIISEAIAGKKGSYEVAKELIKYLNPDIEHPIMNGVRGKINYNAYRLAKTSIAHAYQQASKRASIENPYVKKMRWRSALKHNRTCEVCEKRHNKLYDPEDLPLDHPNGLCTFLYEIDDIEDIAKELKDWINGKENKKLDKWLKK